jgi:hypothetical protein
MLLDLTSTASRLTHRRHTWRPLLHHYSQSFPAALACYCCSNTPADTARNSSASPSFPWPRIRAPARHTAQDQRTSAISAVTSCSTASVATLRRGSSPCAAASPQHRAMNAYSDPVSRHDCTGTVRFVGHPGGIGHQPGRIYLTPAGTVLSERLVRTQER